MIRWKLIALPCLVFSLLCSAHAQEAAPGGAAPYILMQEDLRELRADFNTAVDQVRLVFIVGPT